MHPIGLAYSLDLFRCYVDWRYVCRHTCFRPPLYFQLRARIRMLTYCHLSFDSLAIAIVIDSALMVALTRSITIVLVKNGPTETL